MVKKLIHLMTNALALPILASVPNRQGLPRDSAPGRVAGSGETADPGEDKRGAAQGTRGDGRRRRLAGKQWQSVHGRRSASSSRRCGGGHREQRQWHAGPSACGAAVSVRDGAGSPRLGVPAEAGCWERCGAQRLAAVSIGVWPGR
nr:unnamed protein product [Digitaria exilis]